MVELAILCNHCLIPYSIISSFCLNGNLLIFQNLLWLSNMFLLISSIINALFHLRKMFGDRFIPHDIKKKIYHKPNILYRQHNFSWYMYSEIKTSSKIVYPLYANAWWNASKCPLQHVWDKTLSGVECSHWVEWNLCNKLENSFLICIIY